MDECVVVSPQSEPTDAPAVPSANHTYAELEALLFYYGEALPLSRIAKLLGVTLVECRSLVESWAAMLSENPERGLTLMRDGDTVQLVTKPELKRITQAVIQEEFREELSPAGTETLSLIAYLGPITRPRIDYIRGVNSSFTVRNLLMRGLVDRIHSEGKGHLYEYRVSMQFLKHMGLARAEDLPDYGRYHALLKDFETQRTESSQLEEQPSAAGAPAGGFIETPPVA